ncbi:MAG: ROK family protein [Clostridia bacterium]|nr:ROK family protein [Clostridia bacterium]
MKLKYEAKLDKGFEPMILVFNDFTDRAKAANGEKLVIGIERNQGFVSAFSMTVFPDNTGHDEENLRVVERVVKTLLWVKGGYKIIIAGSKLIYEGISKIYAAEGTRAFDNDFMSGVYEKNFECVWAPIENAPVTKESATPIGRHLDGCRIGFDAGGSDRKVSAVIDGESVYSEEVVWFPKINSDPQYQYDGILSAMKSAAEHLPRVDAIGVSSAGVYIDNRIMVASLFLKVSKEDFEKRVKNMYIDIAKEFGENVPLEVANDGDVTALAGAMDLDDNLVLGIAMGTSEAGGYVDPSGNITGWLNELAFVPVDFSKNAMVDEWSGDIGCGVKYFSQDAVIKLAPAAGIELEESLSPAEKLKVVQGLMEKNDPRAAAIYDTIGVYFGYAIAYYSLFYDIKHVLIMGRVTSGEGGVIILSRANEVLQNEFPELAKKCKLHIPDEKSRRVGQSVAAASLPEIKA